jgi:hypothetical protein
MQTQKKTDGKISINESEYEELKVFCFKCGKRISEGKRWYHADQDDLLRQTMTKLKISEEINHG